MPMTYAYDEATLDLLRLTIPAYGILVPIIKQSGTNEVIDGRHRLKVREELEAEGTRIMLPVHHVDTNNPEEIDQIVNSVRRPWQDAEQRKELVSKLREKGHSHQRIADAVGTAKSTVQNDLKAEVPAGQNRPVSTTKPKATTGKDGKTKLPPATPEEIARAWVMLDAGKGKKEIAAELGRGYSTVREWFKKERPEAVQQAQPKPTPTPEPTPTPTPTPTETDSTKEQILRDWNGQLGDHHERIIRREKPRNRKTEKFLEAMGLIKSQLKQTMDAASKDTREHGAGFLRMYMVVVEEQLRRENVPQIKPSLEALRKEARDIWKYADESLRLLQLQEGCSELK